MHQRCINPKNASYRYYGARGITVCDRWSLLTVFIEDMGLRPEGMTLDRLDNEAGYSPENCRWSLELDQQRNRRNVKCTIEIARRIRSGEFDGLQNKEIAAMFGFDRSAVSRIKNMKAWPDA